MPDRKPCYTHSKTPFCNCGLSGCHMRAVRLPYAGRTVASCGLYSPQLRDEENHKGQPHFTACIARFYHVYSGVPARYHCIFYKVSPHFSTKHHRLLYEASPCSLRSIAASPAWYPPASSRSLGHRHGRTDVKAVPGADKQEQDCGIAEHICGFFPQSSAPHLYIL